MSRRKRNESGLRSRFRLGERNQNTGEITEEGQGKGDCGGHVAAV